MKKELGRKRNKGSRSNVIELSKQDWMVLRMKALLKNWTLKVITHALTLIIGFHSGK